MYLSNKKLHCNDEAECTRLFSLNDVLSFFLDACRHHPGTPFFHDAYKGWSCCNKKSVDFTEFLNIKGCQVSKHSNVKPPEPAKPAPVEIDDEPVIEIREPVKPSALQRPSFDGKLIALEAIVAPALKESIDKLVPSKAKMVQNNSEYDSQIYFIV